MDLLQEQHARERENTAKLQERLNKAAQASKVAMGLLDLTPVKGPRPGSLTGSVPGSVKDERVLAGEMGAHPKNFQNNKK